MTRAFPTRTAALPRSPDSRDGNGQHSQPNGQLRRRRAAITALAALVLPLPAAAQPAPTLHQRAIAAGYKALTLCSAVLDASLAGATRSQASVEANELKGIYPEYDALVGTLSAEMESSRVLVRYDPAMPPRVATLGTTGCTILPIGTDPARAASRTLRLTEGPEPAWPEGDRDLVLRHRPSPALTAAIDRAFTPTGYGTGHNTVATLVLKNGAILAERYAPGFGARTPTRTWSVAKSISGTLIGIAVQDGLLDPRAPAPVPEWQHPGDPRAAIPLDALLRMASGLHSDTAGNRTDAIYFGGTAVTEETVAWPLEAPPGSRFRYANNDILLAIRALRSKLPEAQAADFPRRLFGPLAMRRTFAEQDWQGNFVLSSQVWATARDLARLGQFWLQDGVWNGKRLLPEGWVKYMTTPSGPQPDSGPGYGATLWLFGPKQGLPEGSYAAQGNRGQYVMVIPSRRLVIVRRGEDPGAARFDIARFAADVIEALP